MGAWGLLDNTIHHAMTSYRIIAALASMNFLSLHYVSYHRMRNTFYAAHNLVAMSLLVQDHHKDSPGLTDQLTNAVM